MANICTTCGDPKSGCPCFNVIKEKKQGFSIEATTAIATTAIAAPSRCSNNCDDKDKKPLTRCGINGCGFWFCSNHCYENHFHFRCHKLFS